MGPRSFFTGDPSDGGESCGELPIRSQNQPLFADHEDRVFLSGSKVLYHVGIFVLSALLLTWRAKTTAQNIYGPPLISFTGQEASRPSLLWPLSCLSVPSAAACGTIADQNQDRIMQAKGGGEGLFCDQRIVGRSGRCTVEGRKTLFFF